MTPNKENLRKLVAALRSGEFKQYSGGLSNPEGTQHCCLGVACEIYRRETGNGEWVNALRREFSVTGPLAENNADTMPLKVAEWFGFITHNIWINKEEGWSHYVSDLNDSGVSFSDIADAIEKQYELLGD